MAESTASTISTTALTTSEVYELLRELYGTQLREFLDRAVESAARGERRFPATMAEKPRPVLLLGPPGIGKTESIDRFSDETFRQWCGSRGGRLEETGPRDALICRVGIDGREVPVYFVKIPGTSIDTIRRVVEGVARGSAVAYVYAAIPATHVFPEDIGVPRKIEDLGAVEMLPVLVFKLL